MIAMGVNKVVYGSVAVIDISDSTVTADTLAKGITAYDKAGEKITGTMEASSAPTLQEKTVTPRSYVQNITADSGYDGLSKVRVQGDVNLAASNIKSGTSIFGVTGTYEGSGGSASTVILRVKAAASVSASGFSIWANGTRGVFQISEEGEYEVMANSMLASDDMFSQYIEVDEIGSTMGTYIWQVLNSSAGLAGVTVGIDPIIIE